MYIVYADCVEFYSKSRNARKHLKDTGASLVIVCKAKGKAEVCRACRTVNGLILVGAHKEV